MKKHSEECKMQNAKCKMTKLVIVILQSAICNLQLSTLNTPSRRSLMGGRCRRCYCLGIISKFKSGGLDVKIVQENKQFTSMQVCKYTSFILAHLYTCTLANFMHRHVYISPLTTFRF